jgi:hypothetical protein
MFPKSYSYRTEIVVCIAEFNKKLGIKNLHDVEDAQAWAILCVPQLSNRQEPQLVYQGVQLHDGNHHCQFN